MGTNEELNSIKLEILNAVQEARNAAADIHASNHGGSHPSVLEGAKIRLTYVEEQIALQLERVNKLLKEEEASHSS